MAERTEDIPAPASTSRRTDGSGGGIDNTENCDDNQAITVNEDRPSTQTSNGGGIKSGSDSKPHRHVSQAPTSPSLENSHPHTASHTPAHDLPFVQPSSYLRPHKPSSAQSRTMPEKHTTPLDKEQMQALRSIREFLKVRTSYDVLPLSYRLVVLDVDLLIKKCIGVLVQNGIVSAPLWDSKRSKFVGLLTSNDFLNVIQYYCQFPDQLKEVDQFRLGSMRDIEKAINVRPIETVSVHPMRPLYEACRRMLSTRARRIPLVDVDDETGREWVVCVLTQYRILKFIAVNNETHTSKLRKSVREIGLGTFHHLATARMSNTVLDVVHLMVKYSISSVPIVDKEMRVLNVFEAVDVIPCIKGGKYDELSRSVGEALTKRNDDFGGMYCCNPDDRLDAIFDTIRKSRVHRIVVVDDNSRLRGVISLSDILKYLLLTGEEEDRFHGT